MPWYSSTTVPSDRTLVTTLHPRISHSPPRHHRLIHSLGRVRSTISLESRGSSGTFGVRPKGSFPSLLDQESVTGISEEDLEDVGADEEDIYVYRGRGADDLTPTVATPPRFPAIADTPSLRRPQTGQPFPVHSRGPEPRPSTVRSRSTQVSTVRFLSIPPERNLQSIRIPKPGNYPAISTPVPSGYTASDPAITSRHHRVFSLPSSSPMEASILNQLCPPVAHETKIVTLPLPRSYPALEARSRYPLQKPVAPSIPSIASASSPTAESPKRIDYWQHAHSVVANDLQNGASLRRESAATVTTTTSTGTFTSKRLRLRKSITNVLGRIFPARAGLMRKPECFSTGLGNQRSGERQ